MGPRSRLLLGPRSRILLLNQLMGIIPPLLPCLILNFPLQSGGVVTSNRGRIVLLLLPGVGVVGVQGVPGVATGVGMGVPTLAGAPTEVGIILTQGTKSGQLLQSKVMLKCQ